jgi:serine/threonine protein kinase
MVDVEETLSGTEQGPSSTLPFGRLGGDELLPATLIHRYQIESRLGAGAMGVVYAARDIHLGRTVAVKVVAPRVDAGSGQSRLVREAQAMAKLRHPNLATVHDIGVSGDRLFVVMELVDGGTVADWLRAAPRSWRAVVTVYLQAARGLSAAHAAGFVHRDFKPENVLLGTDGVARVSDFGVARIIGDAERAGAEGAANEGTAGVVGTPGYIAPEILRHEPVDVRADQFSFCVALYAAVYGERPFDPREGPSGEAARTRMTGESAKGPSGEAARTRMTGESAKRPSGEAARTRMTGESAKRSSRIAQTLGPLRQPRAGIAPRWLQRIVLRGLAVDPRDRWPTMQALVAAIERRMVRRRRAVALVGIGVTAVAALVMMLRGPPAPPPDWSPVVIGRETKGSPFRMVVSRDGATLASVSPTEAWVEPRDGVGIRRRVVFPFPDAVGLCRLSRTGDRLFCSFDRGQGGLEIWAFDIATGEAQRRVPPSADPRLKPSMLFDVGPDGSLLFSAADLSAMWQLDPSGAIRRVVTAKPGDLLTAGVWSPDGTRIALRVRTLDGARIEVMTAATRSSTVVSYRICKDLEWLSDSSLACAPRTFRNPVVVELLVPAGAGGGLATERVRYNGPEFHELVALHASSDGVLLSTSPNDKHLQLVALDPPGGVRPIASGGVTDLPAAGWTSSGSLIFGASVQGHLRIMAARADHGIETVRAGPSAEVPLVVRGDTIVFGRFPGGESTIPFFETPVGRRYPDGELFRLALPGGAVVPLGKTRGFSALVCAGAHATPCLLMERSEGSVTAIDWDPETGRRGPQRGRWPTTSYAATSALSPDGNTLAQVHRVLGSGQLSLLDLQTGARRRIAPGTSLDFPRWHPDGTLLARRSHNGAHSIVRVRDADDLELVAIVPARDEPLTAAEDFQVAPDGKTAAILMTDFLQTHWWVPRSPD